MVNEEPSTSYAKHNAYHSTSIYCDKLREIEIDNIKSYRGMCDGDKIDKDYVPSDDMVNVYLYHFFIFGLTVRLPL